MPERPSFDELQKKTVAQLREIASELEHDAVKGYTQMHKATLLHAVCVALGLEEYLHHNVVGVDKRTIKTRIRSLKTERDAALAAGDHVELKRVRRQIHRLKRQIRTATV